MSSLELMSAVRGLHAPVESRLQQRRQIISVGSQEVAVPIAGLQGRLAVSQLSFQRLVQSDLVRSHASSINADAFALGSRISEAASSHLDG